MSTPSATCSQCGASAAGGRIFCDKCGAALQTPVPLAASDFPDTLVKINTLKRAVIVVIKGIGAIAVLVFGFSPMTTNTGILLFGASIVVGFFCAIALSYLDDNFPKGSGKEGYWPKPLDWSRSPNNSTNEIPTDNLIDAPGYYGALSNRRPGGVNERNRLVSGLLAPVRLGCARTAVDALLQRLYDI